MDEFCWIYLHTDQNGVRLIGDLRQGNKPIALPATTSLSETMLAEDLPSAFVQDVAIDSAETRNNFTRGMGDLFADDEGDLWT